jgi:hypothetical protein
VGRQGPGLKSERKRKRQLVRHRETERQSKEAAQEMSARKGKKNDRVTATETQNQTNKKNSKNNKIKCLLATSSGSLQAASIPSFLILVGISEHRLAAAAAFHAQKNTHTHTHTHSLSLSKLEFTIPWAPEKDLD